MKTFKKLIRVILKITIIPTAFGFIAFALFKESFLSGFISGLVIVGGLHICFILVDLYEWTFTEDKPKGYKEEGALEIVSNPIEKKSPRSTKHPICDKCQYHGRVYNECFYKDPISVEGISQCLHVIKKG